MPLPTLEELEWFLIQGTWPPEVPDGASDAFTLTYQVTQGDLKNALTSSFARGLLTSKLSLPFSLISLLSFPRNQSSSHEIEVSLLATGAAFLHAYIQLNWTGPDLSLNPISLLTVENTSNELELTDDFLNQVAVVELAYGGEPAYHLSKSPIFLRLALLIFSHTYTTAHSAPWWRLRAMTIHQYVLDEPAAVALSLFSSLEPLTNTLANQPDLQGRLFLEIGLLHHHFSHDKIAADYFVQAARTMSLEYELTGALGKRTKFQQNELSQLVLLAESRKRIGDLEEKAKEKAEDKDSAKTYGNSLQSTSAIPKTLPLNDDTLLEQTEYTCSQPESTSDFRLSHINPASQPALHPLDQCVLLSLCLNVKNTSPSHGLTTEQMTPYVSRVITHPRNWSVHTMALLLRSRLEAFRTRTVERAVLQLQALIDQMPTSDSTLKERLLYVHDIALPSRWMMEKELGERFMSLGVIRSALDIYERLEMWEEVVRCWGMLDRPDKGKELVRDLLEGRKEEAERVAVKGKGRAVRKRNDSTREAKLWCLLGDLEHEHARDHYERAWDVSGHTSGRAMRSLGGYWFGREEWQKAMDCLREATKINPMLARSWFVLGCAAVRIEKWAEAREAFSRCVAIDDEDGESWSNLASVYLRMGEDKEETMESSEHASKPYSISFSNKRLAYRALQQGVKHGYENWRMWYNYMIVAVDVGELAEAARALSHTIAIRANKPSGEKLKNNTSYIDEAVLTRLVDAVTRIPYDDIQAQQQRLRLSNEGLGLWPRVQNLFEDTLLPNSELPSVFRSWAKLLMWQGKWGEALKAYMDGYRFGLAGQMQKGEEVSLEVWREAVSEVEEIVDILRNYGEKAQETGGDTSLEKKKWLFQARSVVRTFMGKTKENFENEPEWGKLIALIHELREEEKN